MSVYKKLPPCDGDCLNCKRTADKCHGGQKHNKKSPYVKGTEPLCPNKSIGDFGAVHMVGCKIWFKK